MFLVKSWQKCWDNPRKSQEILGIPGLERRRPGSPVRPGTGAPQRAWATRTSLGAGADRPPRERGNSLHAIVLRLYMDLRKRLPRTPWDFPGLATNFLGPPQEAKNRIKPKSSRIESESNRNQNQIKILIES